MVSCWTWKTDGQPASARPGRSEEVVVFARRPALPGRLRSWCLLDRRHDDQPHHVDCDCPADRRLRRRESRLPDRVEHRLDVIGVHGSLDLRPAPLRVQELGVRDASFTADDHRHGEHGFLIANARHGRAVVHHARNRDPARPIAVHELVEVAVDARVVVGPQGIRLRTRDSSPRACVASDCGRSLEVLFSTPMATLRHTSTAMVAPSAGHSSRMSVNDSRIRTANA